MKNIIFKFYHKRKLYEHFQHRICCVYSDDGKTLQRTISNNVKF